LEVLKGDLLDAPGVGENGVRGLVKPIELADLEGLNIYEPHGWAAEVLIVNEDVVRSR
jgi:hypothetical protein